MTSTSFSISAIFKNGSAEEKYEITKASMIIPLESTPSNLSSLVNHLLASRTEEQIPFRFFVQGILLQGPLKDLLEQVEHQGESQVILEYLPVSMLPEEQEQQVCPDWIRTVKAGGPTATVLTGSFDSLIRQHSAKSIVKEFVGHKACVTSLEWLDPETFVSGSNDWTLRLWDSRTTQTKAILKGHEAAVQCLAVSTKNEGLVISGDYEGRLAFWSTDLSKASREPEPMTRKKAKRAKRSQQKSDEEQAPWIKPLSIVHAHKEGHISGLCIDSQDRLFSAGLDHRLNLWDIERATKTSSLTLGNQVSSMAMSSLSSQVIFIASPDGHMKQVDSRTLKSAAASVKLHDGWVNGIACSPVDEYQFCSTGADLKVCLWDRRGLTSGPLKVLSGEEGGGRKMLGLDWSESDIYFGGEDCILHRFS